MTQRDRFLLTLIMPVLVLGGVWFLLLSPQRKEAERLDTELAAQQQRLGAAQSDLIRYQTARDELHRAMRDLAAAGKAVPADTAVPALLRQLEGTAQRAGVEMEAITTATGTVPVAAPIPDPAADPAAAADPTAAAPQATSVDLTLTFRGRFFALERMFGRLDRFVETTRERVEATGRLLSVRDLQLASQEDGLVAQVQASVYVLPDLSALLPTTPADDPSGMAPVADPAAPAPALATATPVTP
jgi:hypothetical protein